tara:strand:- start:2064 stop:2204 length:141 start_codon:yes stop_codon:yes gene_type:complete
MKISAINKEINQNMDNQYLDIFLTAIGITIYLYGLKKIFLNQTKSI